MARILSEIVDVDGNTDFTWKSLRKETPNRASLYVFGTFGSGTVALSVSPDGGTTFIPMLNQSSVAITFTANGLINFELYGNGNPILAETVKIRLALTGSTNASINYIVDDSR